MPSHTIDSVIASIARVTTHTDRESLESSLMTNLFELLELKQVTLYKIINEYGEQRCLLCADVVNENIKLHDPCNLKSQFPTEQITGLTQCLAIGEALFLNQNEQPLDTYIHPLTNRGGEITNVFKITGLELNTPINKSLLTGYFNIYHNYFRLLDDSEHDTLTGLLNRRTFERNLDQILSKWQHPNDSQLKSDNIHPLRRHPSKKEGCWLAEIDIDFFKRINDQYGHLYGDEVLLLLASIMRNSFRSYDKLFRFGGEEFVVILRSTDRKGAEMALERFRSMVNGYDFPQIGQVTVSIGYVEVTNQGIPAAVLGSADEALYYAKEHGRNRVCYYQDLVEQGALRPTKEIVSTEIELF